MQNEWDKKSIFNFIIGYKLTLAIYDNIRNSNIIIFFYNMFRKYAQILTVFNAQILTMFNAYNDLYVT